MFILSMSLISKAFASDSIFGRDSHVVTHSLRCCANCTDRPRAGELGHERTPGADVLSVAFRLSIEVAKPVSADAPKAHREQTRAQQQDKAGWFGRSNRHG
jgi:hypothetical protein